MKATKIAKQTSGEQHQIDLKSFFGQATIDKASALFVQMQQPVITGNRMNVSPRNLVHWVKAFDVSEDQMNGLKYTFVEYVWYNLIDQLRNIGTPFEILHELRNNLFQKIELAGLVNTIKEATELLKGISIDKAQKEKLLQLVASANSNKIASNTSVDMLQLVIVDCIINKSPLGITVFNDGSYMVRDKNKEHLYTESDQNKLLYQTHVTVSIFAIINRFLNSELSGMLVPKLGLLSTAENKLFEVVHSGEYQTITIHFKDKKINSLELKKSEDLKGRLADIVNKGEFGEIIVKKHKGQIVRIENTTRIAL